MSVCDKCGEDIPEGEDYHFTRINNDPQTDSIWCTPCLEKAQADYEMRGDYEYDQWKDRKVDSE